MKLLLASLAIPALAAGALALWSAHLTGVAERRFPPVGRYIAVNGIRLHYTDTGTGPPVVLVHGSLGNLRDWQHGVSERLLPGHRVIAIDRPGHGYSERVPGQPTPAAQAEHLRAALLQLGVERPVLTGFSWGAAVAMAYALRWPAEVGAVVSVAGALYDWAGPIDPIYEIPELPVVGSLFLHTVLQPAVHAMANRWAASAFLPGPVAPRFAEAPLPLAVRPADFRNNAEERRLLRSFLAEQSRGYPELVPPLVILVGEGDSLVRPEIHSMRLHEAVPGSDLAVIPGAGHNLPYSHPEAVAEAILRAVSLAGAARPPS